jgi:hypothetical protein
MLDTKKNIEDWVSRTFQPPNSSYQASIEQLPAAPPFLFTGNSESGYCITIKPASASSSPATAAEPQLGFWIPKSGAQGSQCTMREGDDEILTYAVDWSKAKRTDAATGEETLLAHEDVLTENLSALFAEFLRWRVTGNG